MRVVAKKRVPYAGVYYKPGQEFDIEDKHFKVLSFIGKVEKAKPAPAPEPEPAPKAKAAPARRRTTTQNRTVKADDSAESAKAESDSDEQKRGTYSRRDMKAED